MWWALFNFPYVCGEPRLISLTCVLSPVYWSLLSCYFIFHDYKSFITNYELVGFFNIRSRLGLDRMVVGFITTYILYVIKCLSPLKLWVRISLGQGVIDTTLCDKVYQWLATGRWFPLGTPVSSTNKADYHDITEILLKVALNTNTLITCTQNVCHSPVIYVAST